MKELSLGFLPSYINTQQAITWTYFVIRAFSRCHLACHMMEIQLIYSNHEIDKMAGNNTNDTNMKGNKMIQHFIVSLSNCLVIEILLLRKNHPL